MPNSGVTLLPVLTFDFQAIWDTASPLVLLNLLNIQDQCIGGLEVSMHGWSSKHASR